MKRIFILFFVLISLLTASCGNEAAKVAEAKKQNSDTAKPAPVQARKIEYVQQLNKDGVEQMIFNEYAKQAVNIPKRVLDSFMLLRNPKLIEASITKYASMLDTNVRKYICEKYRINNKELNQIIRKKEKEIKNRKGWDTTHKN